jgi:hypothetical protein
MRKRRYEIHLPLKHNDGREISGELFEQTREELVTRFEGLTLDPAIVFGIWVHNGTRYQDQLILWTVDVEDSPENQQFFVSYKQVLLQRFEQLEIYIVSYPVEII